MSKLVISANYRNRQSQFKYLVRKAHEPIEKARPAISVEVHGAARVCPSNPGERGFGCHKIVEADEANCDIIWAPPRYNRVQFDGLGFTPDDGDTYIDEFNHLLLEADGSMFSGLDRTGDEGEDVMVEEHADAIG